MRGRGRAAPCACTTGAVESMTEAGSRGVGVRVFADGRTGYAYGSDLSEDGPARPRRGGRRARASVTEPDEHAGIAASARRRRTSAALRRAEFGEWTMDRRVELALAVERAARERDPLVSNVEDTVYADSAGARRARELGRVLRLVTSRRQCYAYAYAFAGEGADLHDRHRASASARGPEALDPEAVGAEAADRAVALHGARQPESRRCPVVLDPYVAASFASIIGGTLSARRRPARPLAVRGQGGRADRRPAAPAGRRRPRARRGSRRLRSTARASRSSARR